MLRLQGLLSRLVVSTCQGAAGAGGLAQVPALWLCDWSVGCSLEGRVCVFGTHSTAHRAASGTVVFCKPGDVAQFQRQLLLVASQGMWGGGVGLCMVGSLLRCDLLWARFARMAGLCLRCPVGNWHLGCSYWCSLLCVRVRGLCSIFVVWTGAGRFGHGLPAGFGVLGVLFVGWY